MKSEVEDGQVYPALLYNEAGEHIASGLINEKGIQKSTEHSALWLLSGTSGKLLPEPRIHGLKRIERRGDSVCIFAEAYRETSTLTPNEDPAPNEAQPTNNDRYPKPQLKSPKPTGQNTPAANILAELEALIIQRKAERPADSYTTYLFEQGEAKIRKKLGEEAVETILATSPRDLIAEAADLLYHLLVLCVELNIPFEKILENLHERR